jgi:antitoxin MazE
MGVRASIVRIGNSRGIRIPKSLIDACHLGDAVELSVVDGALVVRQEAVARQDWDAVFKQLADSDADALLDPETPTEFDSAEWECPPN